MLQPSFVLRMAAMETCVIDPCRTKREPRLPETGVFAANPTDCRAMQDLAGRFGLRQAHLFHSNLYYSDTLFLAGPAVGSPMAVICLEKLIALGARNIILYGWCGSLVPHLFAQDLLVPTWALSEEGTSQHYGGDKRVQPDHYLRAWFYEILSDAGYFPAAGPVWTTDAPYRETREKVRQCTDEGIVAVDMEYAALCTVARFRGAHVTSLMLVSDELWRTPWKPLYGQRGFRDRSGNMLAEILRILTLNRYEAK